jgi:cell wall assembly regulator SMI1
MHSVYIDRLSSSNYKIPRKLASSTDMWMRLALEACLWDEAMEKEGEGEDAPADVPAYGRWVPLVSQMGVGKGKGG